MSQLSLADPWPLPIVTKLGSRFADGKTLTIKAPTATADEG